jgi:hypothetical protein
MEKSGHPVKINYSALLKDLGFDPDDFEIVDSSPGITQRRGLANRSIQKRNHRCLAVQTKITWKDKFATVIPAKLLEI